MVRRYGAAEELTPTEGPMEEVDVSTTVLLSVVVDRSQDLAVKDVFALDVIMVTMNV